MSQIDDAVNQEVEEVATTTPESATEENNIAAADDLDSDFQKISEGIDSETDGESKDSEADETKDDNPQPEGDDSPSPEEEFNNLKGSTQDRIRQLANERREAQRRIAELEAQQTRFATEQDLVGEINPETGHEYTPREIEEISWRQSREAQAEQNSQELYELQVQQSQQAIGDEARQIVEEFSILNEQSKDYDPEVANQYTELLNDNLLYQLPDGSTYSRSTLVANNINPDEQAILVGSTTSPYKLAKTIASAYLGAKTQGENLGQVKAQKATEKMLANADSPSNISGSINNSNDNEDFVNNFFD